MASKRMALTALEATTNFITSRNIREGETFSLASLKVRFPHEDELLAVLRKMTEDGFIETTAEGPYRLTQAGYVKFFGNPPSKEDTIKAIMAEIATRGVKAGKPFLWTPMQERLESRRFRSGDLKPALEKIFDDHWLENTPTPGFYKLTEAGVTALVALQ
jgi:DNA-binding PadR family transcriptional regulator